MRREKRRHIAECRAAIPGDVILKWAMAAGQQKRRGILERDREARAERYNTAHATQGGHHVVTRPLTAPIRDKKGPRAPLPVVWWCARCQHAARSPKDIFGSACAATSGEPQESWARHWQRRGQ
eukprot:1334613-Alexandrium_andersonii.AAC.1